MTAAVSDTRAEAARKWFEKICDTNNACFVPLFFDRHRFLVLMGGGGSGKSIFAGRKVLERCATEPGHLALVVRKVANTLRDSCFTQLCAQATQFYPGQLLRTNKSPMEITFRNGSRIIFRGLDDVEKLKSIYNITLIWIEEASEITEADFNQLNIRLRTDFAFYAQIIISFNPISSVHWLKKRFFDRDDPKARTHKSTYKDNRFLIPSARETLEDFRETDEYYYMVYCLGEWGVTGKTVFNARIVSERLANVPEPEATGYFLCEERDSGILPDSVKWTDDSRNGMIRIFTKPEKGVPYVIGADTAGDGSDRFAAYVIDNRTAEMCAVMIMTTGEKEFVNQLFCLGMYYNRALLAPESNFSSYPINELQRMKYPRIYVRQSLDQYTHKPTEHFGFRTDKLTRNTIIANCVNFVQNSCELIKDRCLLEEMLTFVRNEQFRPEAEDGAHDDCVMAFAITLQAREQQSFVAAVEDKRNWNDHQKQLWARADAETRKLLLAEWGAEE